ncbi:MAG: hypothetical protein ABF338_08035, partial [Hyphomonas sp.]
MALARNRLAGFWHVVAEAETALANAIGIIRTRLSGVFEGLNALFPPPHAVTRNATACGFTRGTFGPCGLFSR